MRIKIILFIFTLGLITSAQSQNKHGIAKYGIFVDVNSGIQQSGHSGSSPFGLENFQNKTSKNLVSKLEKKLNVPH